MSDNKEAAHILQLSEELLDDIELNRLSADKLIMKANRLARLSGTEEIRQWLSFELQGYNGSSAVSLKYMTLTGRWADYEKRTGYWGPLAMQESTIETAKAQIEATKITSIGGEWSLGVINNITNRHQQLTTMINRLVSIRSRVIGLIHSFASNIYYERQFADVAGGTFESYKKDVDALIAEKAGDVLVKLPSVTARLRDGDKEAISQALTTCRRILEAFADAIEPPSDDTYELNGNKLSLDHSKHQNRINVYIAKRTDSSSRRMRLRQNLSNLFDRVSTGVHKDVTTEEAFSLFLNVYLFLGETLKLGMEPTAEVVVT
jgi:hypothetical protein